MIARIAVALLFGLTLLAGAVELWGRTAERSSGGPRVEPNASAAGAETVSEAPVLEPPVAPELDVPVAHGITFTR
jgi:hypothetical protein